MSIKKPSVSEVLNELKKQSEMEDLVQELVCEVILQIERHDFMPGTGSFETFSFRVMKNHCFQLKRKLGSAANRIIRNAIPLDVIVKDEDSDDIPNYLYSADYEFQREYDDKENERRNAVIRIVEQLLDTLDGESLNICHALMDGMSVLEVSKNLGLSRGYVRWRLKQMQVRIREFEI